MSAWRHSVLAAVAATASAACGGGQTQGAAFDASWSNDNGAGIGAFQQRFAQTPVPIGAAVAVGVVGGKTIVGVPLDGGAAWSADHALDSRPVLTGTVVVGLGGGELFALDAKTGKPLWRRNAGGSLRGAGDDGKTTVVSLAETTGKGSVVLAVSHEGDVLRQVEDEAAIGVPAVVDGYAFLPWQGQYVTVYDLAAGEEVARVLLRSQTSRAWTAGGALFFGEAGATRFDDKIRLAPANQASTVLLPARELPGSPKWMRPGTESLALKASALDNIALYAQPAASGAAAIEGDRFAATYYRIAVGLDAKSGALAWAHGNDAEIVGGAPYAGGFALCDVKGKVTFVDAQTGAVAGSVSLGKAVEVCMVQGEGFTKKGAAGAPPLAEQLAKAIMMPEAEHVMIQKLLLREMAALQDESVTKALIDLASNPLTPPPLLEDARKALAARRNNAPAMLASLGKPYDFLADVLRPPPVGPIADALGAMDEKKAAPLLAKHLNDPAHPPDDVKRAAAALVGLADKGQLAEIATFFAHYRCMAEDEAIAAAVVSAAQTLVKIGGHELVIEAAGDPATTEPIKPRLSALVKGPEKGKAGEKGGEAKGGGEKKPGAPVPPKK